MNKKVSTPLIAAAEALEQELARFDEALDGLKRLGLKSKKNLDRGSGMLNELGDIEGQIGVRLQALVKAVTATGQAQLTRVSEAKAAAETLQARALAYKALTVQFDDLGAGAASLKDKLDAPSPLVVDVAAEVGALAARAEALQAQAKAEGFDDVVHLADGLKHQLQAVQGKLGRLS